MTIEIGKNLSDALQFIAGAAAAAIILYSFFRTLR